MTSHPQAGVPRDDWFVRCIGLVAMQVERGIRT